VAAGGHGVSAAAGGRAPHGFAARLRREHEDIARAIIDHPFNRELAAGTLDPEVFRFYVAQDAHYLTAFGHALILAAGRAPDAGARDVLLHLAQDGLAGERALHDQFGVDPSVPANAACAAYGDFLRATAACGAFGEAVAALLPCYGIYAEVAGAVAGEAAAVPDHRYAAWIATYDGEAFAALATACAGLVDAAAEACDAAGRQAMARAYGRSIRHEWWFWDAAYRRAGWPI
jgi:thiaminase/transcriptional activator TenA